MNHWWNRLRFLWDEEIRPPEEVPRGSREVAGVPRPLRRAAHFALVGTIAIGLFCQVVEIRLIAPVDASPSYKQQCEKQCDDTEKACNKSADDQDKTCNSNAMQAFQTCTSGCPKGDAGKNCRKSCETQRDTAQQQCDATQKSQRQTCEQQEKACDQNCDKGK